MIDGTGRERSGDSGIDSRILTHLLAEISALLEELQTHGIVEAPTAGNVAALSRANWWLATSAAWALQQLNPAWGDGSEGTRLLAPAPTSPPGKLESRSMSATLEGFVRRVERLHDRACRLEELSGAPTVRSAEAAPEPVAVPVASRESCSVIRLHDGNPAAEKADNAVLHAQKRLRWLLSAQ